jgi:acetyl-CoA C-acetyltransferase
MVSQACATGVASLQHAAASVGTSDTTQLVVNTDRTSNGPLLVQPNPSASGGTPGVQVWVLEAFARDPWAGTSMLDAAEAVAAVHGFTRAEADELAVMRHEQYAKAVADPSFQKAYMVPVEIASRSSLTRVDGDEGVRPATAEGVATLRPAVADGVHTFATQTHPADGSAGCVVTSVKRARELSIGGEGVARILSAAIARVAKTRMPEAPVPAALAALDAAGLEIKDVDAINSHNPFAVNDLYFARQTGVKPEEMNRFGCSLVYGHPQAPTGLRSIVELIEELRRRGGGTGLFTGCAAGDTAGAVVINVTD